MILSICIPQYNRSEYLRVALQSIADQDDDEWEVLISDDCSTDDSCEMVNDNYVKEDSRFQLIEGEKNIGYDRNLRRAMAAAVGDYILILGNDDCLEGRSAIRILKNALLAAGSPDLALADLSLDTGAILSRRLGSAWRSPALNLLRHYRVFSCVTGFVVKRQWFINFDGPQADGTVFYQVFLASRCIWAGARTTSLREVVIRKDLVLFSGERHNEYEENVARKNQVWVPTTGGLDGYIRAVAVGFPQTVSIKVLLTAIVFNIYVTVFPFWLFDYRRIGQWRAAVNLVRGCNPIKLGRSAKLSSFASVFLFPAYAVSAAVAMIVPIRSLALAHGIFKRVFR